MPRERFNSLFKGDADEVAASRDGLWSGTGDAVDLEEHVQRLFENFRTPVYQYLLSVFGEPADAEDLTQEAFLRLYKTLLKGQEILQVRFWIFRVAHNLAVDKLRYRQFVSAMQVDSWDEVERMLPDAGLNPEQVVLRRERFDRLFSGLKRLTLNERQTLYLRAEGFRYREIAEIMDVGVPTVGEYLRRSIKKLGDQGGE